MIGANEGNDRIPPLDGLVKAQIKRMIEIKINKCVTDIVSCIDSFPTGVLRGSTL